MVKNIDEKLFLKLVEKGFFDDWKTLADVIKKISQSGYTISKGKKRGMVARMLTILCQKNILEREEISENQIKEAGGKWRYKKVR